MRQQLTVSLWSNSFILVVENQFPTKVTLQWHRIGCVRSIASFANGRDGHIVFESVRKSTTTWNEPYLGLKTWHICHRIVARDRVCVAWFVVISFSITGTEGVLVTSRIYVLTFTGILIPIHSD